ncbi:MAG: type II toxin-antitoxin system Phd/YefM family antitoxin [Gemmatimonadota bacterium]|nr:type II toxin-antitoxin system Phd/YefM family antitoxin [Gemmatimonadota bacterium]
MRTDDIQPLSEHRAHLTAHFQHVQQTGRPLFVTSNGRTAAVVLSPEGL